MAAAAVAAAAAAAAAIRETLVAEAAAGPPVEGREMVRPAGAALGARSMRGSGAEGQRSVGFGARRTSVWRGRRIARYPGGGPAQRHRRREGRGSATC